MKKTMSIADFLLPTEIVHATELYKQIQSGAEKGSFAEILANEVIRPNISRIDQALGQANDPKYLAYAVEYALSQIVKRK